MAAQVVLEQSGPMWASRLVLDGHAVCDKAAPPGTRLVLALRDVLAVLRDAEKVHIVGAAGAITFLSEAGRPEFEYFVDQLISRLVKQA